MLNENKFIKHIVETKKRVNEWPEWKRNLLGGDEFHSKTLNTSSTSGMIIEKEKSKKI